MFNAVNSRHQAIDLLPMFAAVPTVPTRLAKAITPSDTEIEVENAVVLAPGPNLATLANNRAMTGVNMPPETVYYEKIVGNTLTGVIRAYDNATAPMPHEAGTIIKRVLTAIEHNTLIANIELLRDAILDE